MMLRPGFKDGPAWPWIEKDLAASLDYTIDWSGWLAVGETLSGPAQWTVAEGLTLTSQTDTGTMSTAWLSGGAAGMSYLATAKITTSAGRTDERSFLVAVMQR